MLIASGTSLSTRCTSSLRRVSCDNSASGTPFSAALSAATTPGPTVPAGAGTVAASIAPAGSWFVELAPISDPELVPSTIACLIVPPLKEYGLVPG